MKLSFQTLGFHIFLSGTHLIRIAADRIDLSIMYNKTVRMRSLPAWICVRTESGMNQCDCRLIIRILQISKEQSGAVLQETFLYNDGSAGKRCHIGIIMTLLKDSSYNIKLRSKSSPCSTFFGLSINPCIMHGIHSTALLPSTSAFTGTSLHPRKFSPSFSDNDFENLLCLISL